MEQQLTLDLIEHESLHHGVIVYRDNERLFGFTMDSFVAAQDIRRRMIALFQRSYRLPNVVWEDNPRGSGWYGMKPQQPKQADTFCITTY